MAYEITEVKEKNESGCYTCPYCGFRINEDCYWNREGVNLRCRRCDRLFEVKLIDEETQGEYRIDELEMLARRYKDTGGDVEYVYWVLKSTLSRMFEIATAIDRVFDDVNGHVFVMKKM